VMAWKGTRKLWVLIFIAFRNFTDGCENNFIAPTAWYYIESLGKTKWFLAIVLSSFNLSALIASPIVGCIADRFGHVKFLIMLTYVAKVLGNLLYSVNTSAYFPLFGRTISGIAESSFGIFMAQVALYTTAKDRAGVFAVLEGVFVLGAACGPAIGSFVTFNTTILGWKIDAGNSPGIVLTVIWCLSFIGLFWLPKEFGEKSNKKKKEVEITTDTEEDQRFTKEDRKLSEEHRISTEEDRKLTERERRLSDHKPSDDWNSRVLCLFYLMFWNAMFSNTSTFYTPLLGMDILHLKVIHIKLYFLNGSLTMLVILIGMYVTSDFFKERKVFVFSMIMQISAISLLALFVFTWHDDIDTHYYILLLYICLGMPYFAFPSGCSLLSKITHHRNSAFFQGSSLAIMHLAVVVARLTASFIFSQLALECYSLGLAFFWLVGVIWFGVLYRTF
ncbi:major facilitator superfamily domain-containing 8-like, partial [Paramuricea clavata]